MDTYVEKGLVGQESQCWDIDALHKLVTEVVGGKVKEQIQRVDKKLGVFDELLVDCVEIEVHQRIEALQNNKTMEAKRLDRFA